MGYERFTVIDRFDHTANHFMLSGVKLKDIYPLIGGKHKNYKVCVVLQDQEGQVHSKEFLSPSGNEAKIARIWPEVNKWIMDMTGVPTSYTR